MVFGRFLGGFLGGSIGMAEIGTLTGAGLAGDAGLAAALLRLNNDDAAALSPLDAAGLGRLVARSFWTGAVRGGSEGVALLIAFDERAEYESPNFRWFGERYERFVYVDRVVVGAGLRGRGVARALYAGVFAAAEAAGHERVVCEVNVVPPNPGSMRLHEGLGFRAVGEGSPMAGKRVRYLERRLGGVPSPAGGREGSVGG